MPHCHQVDGHCRVPHGDHQHLPCIPGVELDPEHRAGESEPVLALPGDDVPHTDTVVRGGGGQHGPVPAPGQGAHGVDMGSDDLSNTSGEEVPDDNPAIIAANSKEGAITVEDAGHGDEDQRPVKLLQIILTK